MTVAHAASVGLGPHRGARGFTAVRLGCLAFVSGLRTVIFSEVTGRIASVVVVIAIGVVHRVHRMWLVTRRRCHWTETVVVVAIAARTMVVVRARSYVDDHPALSARTLPKEGDRFKIFKGGKAVQLVAHLVVGHDGEGVSLADTVGRNLDGDSLDAPRAYFYPFLGVAVAFVGVEIEANAASIGVVANVLDIIVDCDGIGVVGHHGL